MSWSGLLPAELRELADRSEGDAFEALVNDFASLWKSSCAVPNHDRLTETLKYTPALNGFLSLKTSALRPAAVDLLAVTVLDLILTSGGRDLFAETRWANLLAPMLWRHRVTLTLEVPWRPLFDLLHRVHLAGDRGYEGGIMVGVHVIAIARLCRRARRYFSPSAPMEMWALAAVSVRDTASTTALESLGFLGLMLPTATLGAQAGQPTVAWWTDVATEWLDLWDAVPHCKYWASMWFTIFARLARMDPQCALPWSAWMPRLASAALGTFEVPLGGAQATAPVGRRAPREVQSLFVSEFSSRVRSAARLFVTLLTTDGGGSLPTLQKLAGLLDHFYHPSNVGTWSPALSGYLRALTHFYSERLARAAGGGGAHKERPCYRATERPLPPQTRAGVESMLLALASRAQYSKNDGLAAAAAAAMSRLAQVAPTAVLPLLVRRFQGAMVTATATHQLSAAMNGLALAARQIAGASPADLAAGEDLAADVGPDGAPLEPLPSGRQVLADAMMASLPGLDANDPAKTLSTLRLHCTVVSCTPVVGGGGNPSAFPLDWAAWTEDFINRLFTLLHNLDQPAGSKPQDSAVGDAGTPSSFLMLSTSLYRPTLELLFGRLSPELYTSALDQVAGFMLSTVLASVPDEAGAIVSAAVLANPALAVPRLVAPLLDQILADLPPLPPTESDKAAAAAAAALSPGAEAALCWRLRLCTAAVHYAGAALPPHGPVIRAVLAAAFVRAAAASSLVLAEAASQLLGATIGTLVLTYPMDQFSHVGVGGVPQPTTGPGLAPWFAKTDCGPKAKPGLAVTWHVPTGPERALAAQLIETHLEGPAAQLEAMCRPGGGGSGVSSAGATGGGEQAERNAIRGLLLQMLGVLGGGRWAVGDFTTTGDECIAPGDRWTIVGAADTPAAVTTSGALARPGARDRAAAAVHSAIGHMSADFSEGLSLCVRACDELLGMGRREYSDAAQSLPAWRLDAALLSDNAVAYLPGGGAAAAPQRPRWLLVERAYLLLMWRTGQAGYRRRWARASPAPVPAAAAVLASDLLSLAMHRYRAVRRAAVNALERALKRMPGLAPGCIPKLLATFGGSSRGASGGAKRPGDVEEEPLLGACAALSTRVLSRAVARTPSLLAGLMIAMVGSAGHDSPAAQAQVSDTFLMLSMRLSRSPLGGAPPELAATRASLRAFVAPAVAGPLESAGSAGAGGPASPAAPHWRYALMASVYLLYLVHPGTLPPPEAGLLAAHAWRCARSDVAPLRPLGLVLLLILLGPRPGDTGANDEGDHEGGSPASEGAASAANRVAVSASAAAALAPFLGDAAEVASLVNALVLNHTRLESAANGAVGGADPGSGAGGAGGVTPESLLRALATTVTSREWPVNRTSAAFLGPGGLVTLHANLAERLLRAAHDTGRSGAFLAALGPPLSAAAAGAERSQQALAAELCAGLMRAGGGAFEASGTHDGDATAWPGWLKPALVKGLADAKPEDVGTWAAAVRYATASTSPSAAPDRAALVALLGDPATPGAPSAHVAKRLAYATAVLADHAGRPLGSPLVATLLRDAPACLSHPSRLVREQVGRAVAVACGALGRLPLPPPPRPPQANVAASLSPVAAAASAAERCPVSESLRTAASSLLATLLDGADAAAKVVLEETIVGGGNGGADAGGADGGGGDGAGLGLGLASDPVKAAKATLESTLHLLLAAIKAGDAPALLPFAARLLAPLIRVQESPDKDFALVAKAALAYLRHVPVSGPHLESVAASLEAGVVAAGWHARAAAVSFAGAFSLKHAFLLPAALTARVAAVVVGRLCDPQLEVRELAAGTLAGLVKGAVAPGDAAAMRATFLRGAAAGQVQAAAERRAARAARAAGRPAAAVPAAVVAARHGPLLGLSAFVLSSPYEVPQWLPECLMALADSAVEAAPLCTTVTKTFADFKRTHTDTWAETLARFTEEQREQLASLALQPSYFC